MSKLNYPEDGLACHTKDDAEACISGFQAAINDCNMYIPQEFPYRDWLIHVDEDFRSFKTHFENISRRIDSLDTKMRRLEDNSNYNIDSIEITTITEKERLIK